MLKDIYFLNYIKTKELVSKYYKEENNRHHYAGLLMLTKLTLSVIFPIFEILDYLKLRYLIVDNKIYYFIAYGIFFLLDYLFIEKKFKSIKKRINSKNKSELSKIRFNTRIIILLIILFNIYFLFFFNR